MALFSNSNGSGNCRGKNGRLADSRSPGMHFNLWTLSFKGKHRQLEKPFCEFYFRNSIQQVRLAVLAAIVLCTVYGIYDYWSGAAADPVIWVARFGIMIPVCTAIFISSFRDWFQRWMKIILSGGIFVVGAAMIAMIVAAPENLRFAYLAGFVQVVFYACTLLRIRFIWAAVVVWALVVLYAAVDIWLIGSRPSVLLANLFFLAGTALMGMMASYAIEYYTRREYFLLHHLSLKSDQLAAANKFLEQRVKQRTKALAKLNASLQEQISKQKKTAKALLKSKERYRQIVDNVTDYICVHNLEGLLLEANRQFRDKLGYGPEDGGGLRLDEFIAPKFHPELRAYLNELQHKGSARGLLTLMTRDGKRRLVEYRSQIGLDENDRPLVFGSGRDITESWKTSKALKESQKQFQSIFESAPAGIVILNASDGRITNVNPAAARLIGLPVEDLVGRKFSKYIAADCQPSGCHTPERREAILRAANDTEIPVLKNERLFTLKGREHIAVSFIDISSIKAAEAAKRQAKLRLAQAQHLQALGTLAGGIAHDFNNILYGMLGFTELALDDAPPGSDQEANLREVLAGGRRAKDLIAQILDFSRQSRAEKKPVNLVPLIKEAVRLVRASLPATINIATVIDEPLDTVSANSSQIHQVLLNLCTNAAHAMEGGAGSLKIAAGNVTLTRSRVSSHGILPAGRYVVITVSDNGRGMSEKVLRRIFEPFFTTREAGKGTGMGLAVVHGIVKSHGGLIDVKSKPGRGSTFRIYLPAILVSGTRKKCREDGLPSGSGHILFVDDEKPLRTMVANTLGKLGYTVQTCKNGLEAWKAFRQNPRGFNLVITDLTMPRMTGLELARKIRRKRPEMPIIICTGFNYNDMIRHDEDLAPIDILNKPIDRYNLAIAIRRALEAMKTAARN